MGASLFEGHANSNTLNDGVDAVISSFGFPGHLVLFLRLSGVPAIS